MERAADDRRAWWGIAILVASAAILSHQLLFKPIVGLADNGDGARVTDHLGLFSEARSIPDRYFNFVVRRYRAGPSAPRHDLSSEILLAGTARMAALPFSSRGTFDLRWVGAVHALALLLAGALLWRSSARLATPALAASGCLAVFMFTDVGYVAPLDSFYTQAASLVFLFWTVAMAAASLADGGRRVWPIAGYFAAALLFVASKPQEAAQCIPLSLFGFYLARRPGRRRIAAGGAALLVAAAAALYVGTHGSFQEGALYKMVFYEILPRSPDPAADVRALGLDASSLRLTGTTNYGPKSPFADPRIRASLFPKLGYRALARFFITHPARAASELTRAAPDGLELRAAFGNFEKEAGFRPGARSAAYSAWTRIRLAGTRHASLLLGLFFAFNAVLAAAGRIPAPARAGLGALVAVGGVAFFVCSLTSAHLDLSRKLYVFHAVTDFLIVSDLALAVQAAARTRA